jgi:uncharacterized protein (DUF4415 family)
MTDQQKKDNRTMMNVKLDKDLRDAFVETCKGQDTTAAQVLRHYMRDYVRKYGQKKLEF